MGNRAQRREKERTTKKDALAAEKVFEIISNEQKNMLSMVISNYSAAHDAYFKTLSDDFKDKIGYHKIELNVIAVWETLEKKDADFLRKSKEMPVKAGTEYFRLEIVRTHFDKKEKIVEQKRIWGKAGFINPDAPTKVLVRTNLYRRALGQLCEHGIEYLAALDEQKKIEHTQQSKEAAEKNVDQIFDIAKSAKPRKEVNDVK